MSEPTSTPTNRYGMVLNRFGMFVVLAFPFTFLMERSHSRVFEVGLLIFTLLSVYISNHPTKKIFYKIFLVMIAFFLFMSGVNYWAGSIPEFADLNHARFSKFYVKIFLSFCVAWWIKDNISLVTSLGVCFITAFFVRSFFMGSGYEVFFSENVFSRRYSYGFSNAQHSALFAAISLLIAIPIAIGRLDTSYLFSMVNKAISIIVIPWSFFILYTSETRGVYIGMLAALSVYFLWIFIQSSKKQIWAPRNWLILLIGVGSIYVVATSEQFTKRFKSEQNIFYSLGSVELNQLKLSSSSVRLNQWSLALEKIGERPLAGFGGASKEVIIHQSNIPDYAKNRFGHFHNSYLEISVAYGLIGLMLILTIFALHLKFGVHAASNRKADFNFKLMSVSLLAGLVLFIISNLFESYLMYRSGYRIFAVLGGCLFALYLISKRDFESESDNSCNGNKLLATKNIYSNKEA